MLYSQTNVELLMHCYLCQTFTQLFLLVQLQVCSAWARKNLDGHLRLSIEFFFQTGAIDLQLTVVQMMFILWSGMNFYLVTGFIMMNDCDIQVVFRYTQPPQKCRGIHFSHKNFKNNSNDIIYVFKILMKILLYDKCSYLVDFFAIF